MSYHLRMPNSRIVLLFAVMLASLQGCAAVKPLSAATQDNDAKRVQQLIAEGANVNDRDYGDGTAIWWAAYRGYMDIARMLIASNADLNIKNSKGFTPLAVAVRHGGIEVTRLLLEHGAKVDPVAMESAKITGGPMLSLLVAAEAGKLPVESVPAVAGGASGVTREELARIVAAAVKTTQNSAAVAVPETAVPRFTSPERPNDLAVIVGIESYSDLPKALYAERDADAFKSHVRALGVPERNIVLLKGPRALKSALEKNVEVWLPRMAKSDSRVYFYFSGHGAPSVKNGQAYLVPWDGDPNFLDSTAYPVAKLYKKLGELPAKQVLVALDSCFSGTGGRSVLPSGARPLITKVDAGTVSGVITALTASGSNEISGALDDKGHGAFTWFLLEGLNAGQTTPKALADYLTPRVQDEARRLNRDQTPQLQGDGSWSLR